MKRMFNNKVYDTEAATLVAKWKSKGEMYFEELYLTPTGDWCVLRYNRWEGSGTSIEPQDADHAYMWMRDCGIEPDTILRYFKDRVEQPELTMPNVNDLLRPFETAVYDLARRIDEIKKKWPDEYRAQLGSGYFLDRVWESIRVLEM